MNKRTETSLPRLSRADRRRMRRYGIDTRRLRRVRLLWLLALSPLLLALGAFGVKAVGMTLLNMGAQQAFDAGDTGRAQSLLHVNELANVIDAYVVNANLGSAALKAGDLELAKSEFEVALNKIPEVTGNIEVCKVLHNYGLTLEALGDQDQGQGLSDPAQQNYQNAYAALTNLAPCNGKNPRHATDAQQSARNVRAQERVLSKLERPPVNDQNQPDSSSQPDQPDPSSQPSQPDQPDAASGGANQSPSASPTPTPGASDSPSTGESGSTSASPSPSASASGSGSPSADPSGSPSGSPSSGSDAAPSPAPSSGSSGSASAAPSVDPEELARQRELERRNQEANGDAQGSENGDTKPW